MILGEEIESLVASNKTLGDRLEAVSVIAEAGAKHKQLAVRALRTHGDFVCAVGDTIVDAPALLAANAGVAMGTGDLVSQDAAGIVLTNNNLCDLMEAANLGRRLYSNSRHAASFLAAVHVALTGLVIAPLCAGWPTILKPFHIAYLQVLIAPICAMVLEAAPEDAQLGWRTRFHAHSPSLLTPAAFSAAAMQGSCLLMHALLCYFLAETRWSQPTAVTDAMAFGTIAVGMLALVITNRTWTRPACFEIPRLGRRCVLLSWQWWAAFFTIIGCLAFSLYCPYVHDVLTFTELLPPLTVLTFVAFGLTSALWFEAVKLVLYILSFIYTMFLDCQATRGRHATHDVELAQLASTDPSIPEAARSLLYCTSPGV